MNQLTRDDLIHLREAARRELGVGRLKWHIYEPCIRRFMMSFRDFTTIASPMGKGIMILGVPVTLYPDGAKGELFNHAVVLENEDTGTAIISDARDGEAAVTRAHWILP